MEIIDKPSNPMVFIDGYLSDDCINIIEKIVNLHITRNYKDIKYIILGYDYKNKKWLSKYGETLIKKEVINVESVHIMPFSNPDIFTKNNGMIFYDDDVFETIRIHVDDAVKRILDVMFTVSKNVINYRYIIDIIMTEWNTKNVMILYKDDLSYNIYGDLHLQPIEIKETLWKEFKSIARHRGLIVRDAFKLAIVSFLESRSEILK